MLNTLYEEASKLGYTPRNVQIKAVEWLQSVWDSENKCKVLSSPVASGKSLIARTIAEYNKKNELMTAVLTPQNILIDQYFNEFNDLNFLKGKAHYSCEKYQIGCDEGMQIGEDAGEQECENCPYLESKRKAYEEYITIFNCMSYYILPKFNKENTIYFVDTIIVDEFQSLPSILREMSSIKVWWHDLKWEHGVTCSIPNIIGLLNKYSKGLNTYIYNKDIERKDRLKFINQQKRINFVIFNLENNGQYYICEETKEKFKGIMTDVLIIRPKYVPPQVAKSFFKIAKKVVLMSGTAFSNIWEELGFKTIDYIDLPSPIPINRRQIFITKSIKLNYKEGLEKWDMLQELARQIKDIINKYHSNDNGVILLPYSLAADLKSLMSEEYFIHMDKSTKKSKIEGFMKGDIHGVGIFSGSYEGISLDDCVSRFTIIPKCIYPNLKDTVVKTRMKEYPLSYNLETITTIIQASGRSTRSELDFSYTYILDENFLSLYPRVRKHIPKYFSEALNFGYPTTQQVQKYNQFQREFYENI